MKKLLALCFVFLLFLAPVFSKAKALEAESYLCLYLPAFSIPTIMPNAVILIGENFGIIEDISNIFMPEPIIGVNGYFVSLFARIGYCDKSQFLAIYINMNYLPVFQAGIPISQVFSSSSESSEDLEYNNVDNIKDYLINPAFILPTKEDLELLRPSLIEARSSYPQYRELIDIVLALNDSQVFPCE